MYTYDCIVSVHMFRIVTCKYLSYNNRNGRNYQILLCEVNIMRLVDWEKIKVAVPEGRWKEILSVNGNVFLDPECMQLFGESLYYVDKQIVKENLLTVPNKINVFFVNDFNLTFEEIPELNDDKVFGMHINMVIYPLPRIQKIKDKRVKIFIFTEELVHCIWNIIDETKVKEKVVEILKNTEYKITWKDVLKWELNLK